MKINQVLVESAGATVAFAFGRFNPAHQGHIEVWRAVEQAGANWFIGTNPSTLGPNDPLTFQQKSAWMAEIYPAIAGHIVAEQSVLTLAAYIFKKVRKNENATVAYITDAADWAWSGKLLNQYNGVEGAHGYYKFAQIIHVPSPRVSSATALRDAARADDKVAFYHASGTDPKSKVAGLTYFDTVKQACEKYPLPVKRAKKVKEPVVAEGWKGALAGAAIGSFGGPVGAGIGARIGHWLGNNWNTTSSPEYIAQQKKLNNILPDDSKLLQILKREGVEDWSDLPTVREYLKQNLDDNGLVDIDQFAYEAAREIPFLDRMGETSEWESYFIKVAQRVNAHIKNNKKQGVTEDNQKTVAKTWDQMTPQEKSSGVKGRTVWNEKTKKYYTVFDVPASEVDEASLATMRDYFAGDENARDPMDITKQRLHFSKDKNARPTVDKRFRSPAEYQAWLKQNKLQQISGANESTNDKGWSLTNKRKQ